MLRQYCFKSDGSGDVWFERHNCGQWTLLVVLNNVVIVSTLLSAWWFGSLSLDYSFLITGFSSAVIVAICMPVALRYGKIFGMYDFAFWSFLLGEVVNFNYTIFFLWEKGNSLKGIIFFLDLFVAAALITTVLYYVLKRTTPNEEQRLLSATESSEMNILSSSR